MADLAGVIATLPQGKIVLPGLDPHLDQAAWDAVAQRPSHPQHGMLALLTKLNIPPHQVLPWPGTHQPKALDRHWALSLAQRPPEAPPVPIGPAPDLENLILSEAPGPEAEARAIALFLREALQDPTATAALITPDRDLAGRVAAELQRWDLIIDDSAGVALTATVAGRLVQQSAPLLQAGLDPLALITALGHPWCHVDGQFVQDLDLKLRGVSARLSPDDLAAIDMPWPDSLRMVLSKGLEGAHPLSVWVDRHLDLIDTLCPSLETWTGDVGAALAHLFEDLASQANLLPPMSGADYTALLTTFLGGQSTRAAYGTHPRLAILGTLEARLVSLDAVALGGLNEGTWPKETDVGPWMNRPTRAAIGLPSPERKVGLAAHDLAQAFGTQRVMLSRATRVDGTPTLPSRWLERFKALAERWDRLGDLHAAGRPYLDWAEHLDRPVQPDRPSRAFAAPSAAMVPVEARPKQIWTTDVGLLVTNPYGFYAKRILNLRPLEARGPAPNALLWGNFIHKVLENWIESGQRTFNSLETLALGRLSSLDLNAAERLAWQIHLRHTLGRFWEFNLSYLTDTTEVEIQGSFDIGGMTVSGKADRLVRRQGLLHIIDYKTGKGASPGQQKSGENPQLAILGLMALAGGFGGAKTPASAHSLF